MTNPDWKQFELAVEQFIRAIDPTAKVLYDAKIPDVHTKHPRQRDVWVEAKILGHFNIKILISCKYKIRKLNEQDIDAFHGELISSGAHKGIIYTCSGYTKYAIEKGKALGISCCKLYQNEPADIPEILKIANFYYLRPQVIIKQNNEIELTNSPIIVWNDLFSKKLEEHNCTLLDYIVDIFKKNEAESIQRSKENENKLPLDWGRDLGLYEETISNAPIEITIIEKWRIFKASVEGFLVNGSYSFSEGIFKGDQSGPVIDTWSEHPGLGWTLLEQRPDEIMGSMIGLVMGVGRNVGKYLRQMYGNQRMRVRE